MNPNQDYDRKFEEMKKYIPFLESMIKRLESSGVSSGNPRQAQLDKIRSLRDLLLDKKKRMKMENLLKCEQVLVNLYVKVEQRDTSVSSKEQKPTEKPDLTAARNKLKSVAIRAEENTDTLPEIARAHDVDVSTTGSKEPALFQRRPNKFSKSPFSSPTVDLTSNSPQSSSKRNYTRVLLSPEPSARRWDKPSLTEKTIFSSRRSPRKSPKRFSPSYNKKERKKLIKRGNQESEKQKDWNITLNVPEESLNSLNTKDILSRIINCSDSDVDIDTLRELRTQILGELKHTGAKDDISDLILKSYKSKKNKTKEVTKGSQKEVEEGELSDSESEAIESIYSSLVVVEKDATNSNSEKAPADKDQPRKIQICLMINADNGDGDKTSEKSNLQDAKNIDSSDFVMFNNDTRKDLDSSAVIDEKPIESKTTNPENLTVDNNESTETNEKQDVAIIDAEEPKSESTLETVTHCEVSSQDVEKQTTTDVEDQKETESEPRKFKANFYKPLTEQRSESSAETYTSDNPNVDGSKETPSAVAVREITALDSSDAKNNSYERENTVVEIPLLNDRPVPTEPPKNATVSEIEILQALKNEILSETISLPGSETVTPALHQPKVIKVANVKEILPKNRISIEKYKQQSVSSTKTRNRLYLKDDSRLDSIKKASLKLTEKECERFNLTQLDDISDDDDVSVDNMYGDLAPKSPDHEESNEIETIPPVIIPVDPVKVTTTVTKGDVDMRTLLPMLSSNLGTITTNAITSSVISDKPDVIQSEPPKIDINKTPLIDPRMRRDVNPSKNIDPNPERPPHAPPVPALPNVAANITPIANPNMTPILNPSMTPNSRPFEMTPSHQSLDIDYNRKHVYAPVFSGLESRETREQSVVNDSHKEKRENVRDNRRQRQDNDRKRWEDPRSTSVQRDTDVQTPRYGDAYKYQKGSINDRYRAERADSYSRSECPPTPSHAFGLDQPMKPKHYFGSMDSSTPSQPFGRSDCPATPSHPFGRNDYPPTPGHPFGRSECPPTPSHPFGRSECPTTPSHIFGRSECPTTPLHPFGRSDMPMTPSHPFGRSDFSQSHSHNKFNKDPRLNRSTDNENIYNDRDYYREHSFDHGNSYRSQNRSYNKPDNYRYNDRDKGDQNRHFPQEQNRFPRETIYRREPNVNRSIRQNYEDERCTYRSGRGRGGHYRNENVNSYDEVGTRRNFQSERRISEDSFSRSTTRASSVGRSFQRESDIDNTLSIKRDTGRSFTIDTSVNATFQDVLAGGKEIQVLDYSFDARRRRATSVGRSFTRETSVGRTFFQSESKGVEVQGNTNKKKDFRRACSVGRELASSKMNRSLNEIKADFESYSKTIKLPRRRDSIQETQIKSKDTTAPDPRCRKYSNTNDNVKKISDKKPVYSPRMNYRDPRMRREIQNDSKRRDNKLNKDRYEQKKYGIVYSSDNIAKGTILGSGYGVRNYKIPKIKRPVEEKVEEKEKAETQEVIEKTEINKKNDKDSNKHVSKNLDKSADDLKTKSTDSKSNKKLCNKEVKIMLKTENVVEKRVTRSRKISESPEPKNKNFSNIRKTKKAIIYDSDSEMESDNLETMDKVITKVLSSPDKKKGNTEECGLEVADQNESVSSFCVDMFPDNIVSDPVLDNINALIADLDNDIDTNKNDEEDAASDFTNELSLENMLENITDIKSNDNSLARAPNKSKLQESFEKFKANVFKSGSGFNGSQNSDKECLSNIPSRIKDDSLIEKLAQPVDAKEANDHKLPTPKNTPNNDATVSTTDAEAIKPNQLDELDEKSHDGCSTPDSTINTNEAVKDRLREEEGLADSTIDNVQIEINSDVTSTYSSEPIEKGPAESSSSHKEIIPALQSFGSLLSILQDKSKIKELLGMLGDNSSENEKIKKKLEKLSEIVSDEEESRDGMDTSKEAESSNVTETHTTNAEHPDNVKAAQTGKCLSEPREILETALPLSNETTSENVSNIPAQLDNSIVQPDGIKIPDVPLLEVSADKSNEDQLESEENLAAEDNSALKDDSTGLETENIDGRDSIEMFQKDEPVMENKEDCAQTSDLVTVQPDKTMPGKKPKLGKKGRRGKGPKKSRNGEPKRVTRSAVSSLDKTTVKKPSRELLKLQEDIKEMFMKGNTLNTTGIRMCRLAKLVDEKSPKDIAGTDIAPVVILEKFKDTENLEQVKVHQPKPIKKKPGPKSKLNNTSYVEAENKKERPNNKYKPGPKSKTKSKVSEIDPYEFETDSVCNTSKASDDGNESSSDSENESLASSFGSNEVLSDGKKKRRKRPGWKAGVIKTKKRKVEKKQTEPSPSTPVPVEFPLVKKPLTIPDMNCFVDKDYSFQKNIETYSCRLCVYTGTEIVHHYKRNHPHCEVPLSRLNPTIAKEAIEQCEQRNFQAIMKIPTERYVCRFCSKEFHKNKTALEKFFWHVVSMHTGEYKLLCSMCVTDQTCPFSLDIPPPPKDTANLIAYICGKCNFTQISLENLKTHVIQRHNDEETEVFGISLSEMSKKALAAVNKRCEMPNEPRKLRSLRSQQSLNETNDDCSDITDTSSRISDLESPQRKLSIHVPASVIDGTAEHEHKNVIALQSQITFETDDTSNVTNLLHLANAVIADVKVEPVEVNHEETSHFGDNTESETHKHENDNPVKLIEPKQRKTFSDGVVEYPHFKFSYSDAGTKEYVCCINGVDSHYTTSLLISMKRHIQTKHTDKWDGYCFLCKVIVTPQGLHHFKDCLQHYLDKHIDEIPVLEKKKDDEPNTSLEVEVPAILDSEQRLSDRTASPKSYINVRPLAELIVKNIEVSREETSPLPKIEYVMSLGEAATTAELPRPSPTYPTTCVSTRKQPEKHFTKYEEVQAEVMMKKHRVVLESMMTKGKLLQVFKCAGRYCSFTSDLVEEALLHASTHHRIGGADALNCAYCDFDASGNAIDLVMHVFKVHGPCQYCCAHCFYRGAASQLVGAHMTRIHGQNAASSMVLRSTSVQQPVRDDMSNMLTREETVFIYICAHGDHDNQCKFRTYMPDAFYDHLVQQHASATAHPCSVCTALLPSAKQLMDHMASHNYNMFQCIWCAHGARNESQLVDHSSIHHPTKQPQAYVRVTTNKDGSLLQRVLPLVFLNKSKMPTEDISPGNNHENPVREAERSLELEKLIGHTTMLIQSAESLMEPGVEESLDIPKDTTDNMLDIQPNMNADSPDVPMEPLPSEIQPPRMVTPEPLVHDLSLELTPVLKKESDVPTPIQDDANEVVCLDTDEEDEATQNITEASSKEPPSARDVDSDSHLKRFEKIPEAQLYNCPLCNIILPNESGFRKHGCYIGNKISKLMTCPHCKLVVLNSVELIKHYKNSHGTNRFICEICERSFISAAAAKRHIGASHKHVKNLVTSLVDTGSGQKKFMLSGEIQTPPLTRKRSIDNAMRFGPQDSEKLPINQIMDSLAYCAVCEFSTKVRLNMVRHLQLHAEQQPAPSTAPVNPVPHLETNEMHFDRMVNLASSSLTTRPAIATDDIRFPKFIPARQRYTCGARGCSYTSVDEPTFRLHWEALHSDCYDFVCVHCPPHQCSDNTKPLVAARVLAHLKMHDETLYACSLCKYYHYKQELVEKHNQALHKSAGRVVVVREESKEAPASTSAPTMDLKPWQCGLCDFKSMLRPEVVEHCTKAHQSKMQFKCAYCPFRTSAKENVTKHQLHSHADRTEEVFYFFYREGSIPDEDGVPLWQKQKQKHPESQAEVKREVPEATPQKLPPVTASLTTPMVVDLNLVKSEVDLEPGKEASVEELVAKYGQCCDPNGVRYQCPLCSVVLEDTAEAMQSHLYEELKYRKWSCAICAYKAFHKTGLKEHMSSEHRRATLEPIQLPIDLNIEKWVAMQLEHQAAIIQKSRDALTLQTKQVVNTQNTVEHHVESSTSEKTADDIELANAFGPFGTPSFMQYCCPKCKQLEKDPAVMRDHLETELSKIRWCCSACPSSFTTYHEAQFHCRSLHLPGARPTGAARDPGLRAAWLAAVMRHQAGLMQSTAPQPTTTTDDNSLLVVRYEVPTEESPLRRKRAPPSLTSDDEAPDDDESPAKKKLKCQYCEYCSQYPHSLRQHTVRHYNLKPFSCPYCNLNACRKTVLRHVSISHPDRPVRVNNTEVPDHPPPNVLITNKKPHKKEDVIDKLQCLYCEKSIPLTDISTHTHTNIKPEFAKLGTVVVKCCICLELRLDLKSLQVHHNANHPDVPINYSYFKVKGELREMLQCSHCKKSFMYQNDLMTHHNAVHEFLSVKYTTIAAATGASNDDYTKRIHPDRFSSKLRRIAKKSTTKLPMFNAVAKKSTTKLPMMAYDSDTEEEYSYYGMKPPPLECYSNVTTLMPFFNTMMPFSLKKLSGLINIDPKLTVEDCSKQ